MKKINFSQLVEILKERRKKNEKIEDEVRNIIKGIKKEKDKGVLYYTEKFDKVKITQIKVEKEEIKKCLKKLIKM